MISIGENKAVAKNPERDLAIEILTLVRYNVGWNNENEYYSVYYIPAEDAVVEKTDKTFFAKLPNPQIDLTRYYTPMEWAQSVDEFIVSDEQYDSVLEIAVDDVKMRIGKILINCKGIEDWAVLAALLLDTYKN